MSAAENRTIPQAVVAILRAEVNFACPICGNPYLTFHHFDPPWHEKNHHEPNGMIALCLQHHAQADAGTFTKAELHRYKAQNKKWWLQGELNWRRQQIIAYMGSNLYLGTDSIFNFNRNKVVWYVRDQNGDLRLNIDFYKPFGIPFVLLNNTWHTFPAFKKFESIPSGKRIRAEFPNGYRFHLEFNDMQNTEQFEKFTNYNFSIQNGEFPITVVKVMFDFGKQLQFGTRKTFIANASISQSIFHGCFDYSFTKA